MGTVLQGTKMTSSALMQALALALTHSSAGKN